MVADTWYDGTGKLKKSNETYNAAGAASDELLLVSNGQVGAQSLLEYDGLGRSTVQIFAVSGAEQWRTKTAYEGELTHVDPPVGGVPTTTVTNRQGNVSEIRHYQGSSPGVGVPYDSTKYTYTALGKIETVTDAKGNVWRYEYDSLGRKTRSIDPDAGTSRTEFDELDRPIASWDAREKKTSITYDKLGRVESKWQGDANSGTKLTETRFDKAGWLGQAYAVLNYVSPTEYFATAIQSMDEFYRPLKTAYQIPASQGSLAGTHVFTSTYIIDYTQPQQINGYSYANNSPVTHADPSGMIIPECREGLIECRGGVPYFPKSETEKAQSDVDQASRNVTQAEGQQAAAKQRIKSAGKALVKIARDILGVDAALDCISSGDIGACGETLLNIAGSFAGGLAGKILAKYGAPWNWAKGLKLAKRVTGLVGDLIGGAKGWWNANKAVGKARGALAKAGDKLADARKKAAAALKKGKSCKVSHSFLPGTKVLMAGGVTKPIQKVKLGDKVVATDPKNHRTVVREIVGTIVTQDDKQFVDLTVRAEGGKAEKLVSTTTHPFWVESQKRWMKAGDLRSGLRLATPTGDTVELVSVRAWHKMQQTHDLTVAGIHTYYVHAGATALLVHNCGDADDFVEPEELFRAPGKGNKASEANGPDPANHPDTEKGGEGTAYVGESSKVAQKYADQGTHEDGYHVFTMRKGWTEAFPPPEVPANARQQTR